MSAQCRSSMTSTAGPCSSSAASVASNRPSRAPERSSSPTSSPSCGATSTSGPSGRGEDSGSQAPQSSRPRADGGGSPLPHQRRLAHAGLAMHEDQPSRPRERFVMQGLQGLDQVGPLHQCHGLRVRTSDRPEGEERRDARHVHRRVLREHQPLQLLQLRAGVDAELVGQRPPRALVGRERVGLPAAAVLRAHQQGPERLAHRVPADQRLELGDRRRDAGPAEVGGDPLLEGVQPQRTEPLGLDVERLAAGELGVRPTAPRAERVRRGSRSRRPADPRAGRCSPASRPARARPRRCRPATRRARSRDDRCARRPVRRGRGAVARRATAAWPPRPAVARAPRARRPAGPR